MNPFHHPLGPYPRDEGTRAHISECAFPFQVLPFTVKGATHSEAFYCVRRFGLFMGFSMLWAIALSCSVRLRSSPVAVRLQYASEIFTLCQIVVV